MSLTSGAVSALFNNVDVKDPVLQVLNVRAVTSNGGAVRYRYAWRVRCVLRSAAAAACRAPHAPPQKRAQTRN